VADARLAISAPVRQHRSPRRRQGTLRAWQEGSTCVFEVTDQGVIGDPLVGRVPPRADQVGGFGLWLVHRLCDLVQQRDLGLAERHQGADRSARLTALAVSGPSCTSDNAAYLSL
jgi:hypothetical protein